MSTLITVKEAANDLRVSIYTVWRLIRNGRLPAAKVGGQWRIDRDALDLYIKSQAMFFGDISRHQLYFTPAVLRQYITQPDKYYVQESGHHGRLGLKQDRYDLHTIKSTKWATGPETQKQIDELLNRPGVFSEIKFFNVRLKNGEIAVMLDPKAFYRLPESEQSKWRPYAITNPQM
ncbi:MAG: helix-turn-helix domain-containing protein [Planctomycetes bacterium]|nr:helix-turn-helix domain-containing protein [Planctomycetota bacterium]